MIGWPDHKDEIRSYKLYEPPPPVGYWILYAQATPHVSFAIYKKPLRVQLWLTNKLLGWTWKDAE